MKRRELPVAYPPWPVEHRRVPKICGEIAKITTFGGTPSGAMQPGFTLPIGNPPRSSFVAHSLALTKIVPSPLLRLPYRSDFNYDSYVSFLPDEITADRVTEWKIIRATAYANSFAFWVHDLDSNGTIERHHDPRSA